jgi:hypothetical protein
MNAICQANVDKVESSLLAYKTKIEHMGVFDKKLKEEFFRTVKVLPMFQDVMEEFENVEVKLKKAYAIGEPGMRTDRDPDDPEAAVALSGILSEIFAVFVEYLRGIFVRCELNFSLTPQKLNISLIIPFCVEPQSDIENQLD